MNKKLEDSLGKLAMLLIFGYLAYQHVLGIIAFAMHADRTPIAMLSLVAMISGTVFLCMILYFTVTRLPPRGTADGLEPRLSAVAGTFVMMLLFVLPAGEIGTGPTIVASVLVIVGTILSAYCMRQLGRSFSIMASARELVTEGPYGIVRHPLYGAEVVTIIGVIIGHWSLAAIMFGIVWLGLQIRRAHNEERVLRASFPQYADYARRVPMLLPGFFLRTAA